jgi:hypothetical protein
LSLPATLNRLLSGDQAPVWISESSVKAALTLIYVKCLRQQASFPKPLLPGASPDG